MMMRSLFHKKCVKRSNALPYLQFLVGLNRNLTGHVQLPSLEPLDPASAQVTVLHPVEGSGPVQPLAGHGGPEAVAVGDREVPQRVAARHPLEGRSLRHERRGVPAASPAQNIETRRCEGSSRGPQGASAGEPHGEGAQCGALHTISATLKPIRDEILEILRLLRFFVVGAENLESPERTGLKSDAFKGGLRQIFFLPAETWNFLNV